MVGKTGDGVWAYPLINRLVLQSGGWGALLTISSCPWSGGLEVAQSLTGPCVDRCNYTPRSSLGNGMDAVVDRLARRRWRSMKRGVHQRINHDYKGGSRVKPVLKHLHTRLHLARVVDALTVGIDTTCILYVCMY